MTLNQLNDHFALKSVLGSYLMGWRVLAFRQKCWKICTATHLPSAAKM